LCVKTYPKTQAIENANAGMVLHMADVKEALVYVIPINNRFWSRRGLYRKKKRKRRINKLVIYSNVLVESS
jgi:hypothetical protein